MNQQPVYRFDSFVVDTETWRLSRAGREIHLKPGVLELLLYLIANRGRLVTRQELMDTVWGDTVISEAALTKAVARLRKALGDDSANHRYLETVRSRGYRFVANVSEVKGPNQPDRRPGDGRATIMRRTLLASAAAILALIVVVALWPSMLRDEAPEVKGSRALAMPKQNKNVDGFQDIIDSRAIDAYALGVAHLDRFNRDGIRTAIGQFQTAVAIEPEFALAWGQLALAHAMHALFGFAEPSETIEKWRTAALRAIEADDQIAIGHSALGWARMYTGDFDGACKSFAEALRLDPSEPHAMHGEADCVMLDGRMEESLARIREIRLVSPFSAMHNLPLCSHLFMARRFDEAIAATQDVQARHRQLSLHWFLAMVYWQQGRFDKALEEERLELEGRGDIVLLAALEDGFDAAGPAGAMRSMAEALADRAQESYVNPFFVGEAFARAGMVEEALHWLDQAAGHGSYNMTYLAFWPPFDVLQDDPRFQDLAERVYGSRARKISRAANSIR